MRVLFICNMNQHRSKTAEELFQNRFETKSAGLYNNLVTEEQIAWADVVVVMTEEQRKEIGKRFPKLYLQKRILEFDVPDIYFHQQKELVQLLEKRCEELLHPLMELGERADL